MAVEQLYEGHQPTVVGQAAVLMAPRLGAVTAYALVFRALAALVLVPLSAFALARIIATTGRFSVANTDIASFAFSIPGLLALTLAVACALFETYLEQAGLMLIATGHPNTAGGSFVSALLRSLRRAPQLMLLALIQFAVFLVAALPFLALAGLVWWLAWSALDINYLWVERPPIFWVGVSIGAVLAAGLLTVLGWLYVRWVFALPLCLFLGTGGVGALRLSAKWTRGRRWYIGRVVLGVAAILALATGVGVWLLDGASEWLLGRFGTSPGRGALLAAGLLMVHAAGIFLLSLLTAVTHAFLIVVLYRQISRAHSYGLSELTATDEAPPVEPPRRWLRPVALLAGAAIAVALSAAAGVAILESLGVSDRIDVTAHRGDSSRAPENTVPAIEMAIDAGAEYAEIDVQLTADGEVVVVHDEDLRRLAGLPRKITEAGLEELRSVDAGGWFDAQYAGVRIPTLAEVIDAAGDRIRLNVELKPYGSPDVLVARTIEVIEAKGFASRCVLSSLSYDALMQVRARTDRIPIGYIVARAVGDPTRLNVDFLSINRTLATESLIASAKSRNMPVHVWTVNTPEQTDRMVELGVDNIITDHPAAMRQRIEDIRSLSDTERVLLLFRNRLAR